MQIPLNANAHYTNIIFGLVYNLYSHNFTSTKNTTHAKVWFVSYKNGKKNVTTLVGSLLLLSFARKIYLYNFKIFKQYFKTVRSDTTVLFSCRKQDRREKFKQLTS
jgi:hypothetical protein